MCESVNRSSFYESQSCPTHSIINQPISVRFYRAVVTCSSDLIGVAEGAEQTKDGSVWL